MAVPCFGAGLIGVLISLILLIVCTLKQKSRTAPFLLLFVFAGLLTAGVVIDRLDGRGSSALFARSESARETPPAVSDAPEASAAPAPSPAVPEMPVIAGSDADALIERLAAEGFPEPVREETGDGTLTLYLDPYGESAFGYSIAVNESREIGAASFSLTGEDGRELLLLCASFSNEVYDGEAARAWLAEQFGNAAETDFNGVRFDTWVSETGFVCLDLEAAGYGAYITQWADRLFSDETAVSGDAA